MSHENNEDLSELESALASLAPPTSELHRGASRDRLMYLAGRASVETKASLRRRFSVLAWPLATAAMALIALSLGGLLVRERRLHHEQFAARSEQQTGSTVGASNGDASPGRANEDALQDDTSFTPVEENSRPAAAVAAYVQLRRRVLDEGVDALPGSRETVTPSPPSFLTPRSPLEALGG